MSNDDMNVYMYYIKKDKSLYAFTINKKYARLFEEQRNMNCFSKRKVSMDTPKLQAFMNNYRSLMLRETPLYDGEKYLMIIATPSEDDKLDESTTDVMNEIDSLTAELGAFPLNKKYKELIKDLSKTTSINEIDENELHVNTFELFYYLFKFTFIKQKSEE